MRTVLFFCLSFLILSCKEEVEIYGVWKAKVNDSEISLNFEKNSDIVEIKNLTTKDSFNLSYSIIEVDNKKYFEFINDFSQHKTTTEYSIEGDKLITKSSNLVGLDEDFKIVVFNRLD